MLLRGSARLGRVRVLVRRVLVPGLQRFVRDAARRPRSPHPRAAAPDRRVAVADRPQVVGARRGGVPVALLRAVRTRCSASGTPSPRSTGRARAVHGASCSLSIGVEVLERKLWRRPSVCPTSCMTAHSTAGLQELVGHRAAGRQRAVHEQRHALQRAARRARRRRCRSACSVGMPGGTGAVERQDGAPARASGPAKRR